MMVMIAAQILVATMYVSDGTAMTSSASLRATASSVMSMIATGSLLQLLGDEVEVQGGEDEVQEEQQQERDDHGLVHRVAHALRPTLREEALVAGHRAADEAEHRRLQQ